MIEVDADATAEVLAENSFNSEPEDGKQFFMVTLEAEYTGSESGTAWVDLSWKALGPSAVAYEGFDASCGVIPNELSNAGETFPGGVVSGNVCWSVTAEDAADLVMLLEETFSIDDTRTVYKLDPNMEPIEAASGSSTDGDVAGLEIGEFGQVGDWKVRVIEVDADATAEVLAENSFNSEPEDGKQFFMVTLEAEYMGSESGTAWVDLSWKALGPSAVAYEGFDASCGVIPNELSNAGETFPGGVVSGNVCWSVTAEDATDLVMLLEETFSMDDTRETFRLSQ